MHHGIHNRGVGFPTHIASAAVALAVAGGLLCPAAAFAEPIGSLDIVHINDIHGHYAIDYENEEDGTEATINAFSALKQVIDEVDPAFALDAGDTFHGDSFATVCSGTSVAELLETAGVDATTPGNHDWSYGSEQLESIDTAFDFSVLAANVIDAGTGEAYFEHPYLLREVALEDEDGNPTSTTVTVGVFGVIDEGFYTSTPAKNVEDVRFEDAAEVADDMAEELRTQGADIVVCLSHNADPQELAQQTSGIDAVVAGHEHIAIDDTVTSADGTEVAVVEAPSSPAADYFGTVGVLTLDIADDGDGTYSVEDHAEEQIATADPAFIDTDPEIAAATETILEMNAEILDEPVGTSESDYPYSTSAAPGGWELIRTQDEPIGHLVTGSYLVQTGADLAFENAGGIRGGVTAGDVTAGDLISISPYGNTLSTYKLTGAQIREALETSLDISKACRDVLALQVEALENGEDPFQYSWPSNSGSVLVVGGAVMEIDWDQPRGSRLVSIEVGGAPLDDARTYTVAINSYLPGCTDEYPMFGDMELVAEWGTCEEALRDLVSQDGWEQLVTEVSGSTTYVEAGEDPEPTPEPEPAPDPAPAPGDDEPADDKPVDNEPADTPADSQKPGSTTASGTLPQTGDASAVAGLVFAAGALCSGIGAGMIVRRPRRK